MNVAQMINDAGALGQQLTAWAVVALPNAVAALLILLVGWWLATRAERTVEMLLAKQGRIDTTLQRVLKKIARYIILAVVFVAALSQLGIATTSIIAALGAIGLAVGLALQNTLSNIAAGVMLLWLRPFGIGDYIEAGDSSGSVVDIGLFATELKTFEGLFVFVPNSELWNTKIVNYTRGPKRMLRETFTISYDDDVETAREAILELVRSDSRVHDDPAPVVHVAALGDSAVALELRAWTNTPEYWEVHWETVERGKMVLEAKGITIPYPQQDVHVRNVPPELGDGHGGNGGGGGGGGKVIPAVNVTGNA